MLARTLVLALLLSFAGAVVVAPEAAADPCRLGELCLFCNELYCFQCPIHCDATVMRLA